VDIRLHAATGSRARCWHCMSKEVQSLQAEGTLQDFLSHNMTFYCSRVGPILGRLCQRVSVSFLSHHMNIWSLLPDSSVMGKLETQIIADTDALPEDRPGLGGAGEEHVLLTYLHVRFSDLVLCPQDTTFDIGIQIGRHKTLISKVMQLLSAIGKPLLVKFPLRDVDEGNGAFCFFDALGPMSDLSTDFKVHVYRSRSEEYMLKHQYLYFFIVRPGPSREQHDGKLLIVEPE
jgi:hypothetical protein